MLLTVNAPLAKGRYFGQSFRMYHSLAVGPLVPDWNYRFQDIIFSRRLKTIEIRIFDPIWDLEKIKIVLELIRHIVLQDEEVPLDRNGYNELREKVILRGHDDRLWPRVNRLREKVPLSEHIFRDTCSNQIRTLYERYGLLSTYTALDNAYRFGRLNPRPYHPKKESRFLKIFCGLFAYYLPKLPFTFYKTLREL
jgi:hypothetical protein